MRPLTAALLTALAACAPAPRRPDVVLVVVDTLRADALGIGGADPDPAPFLASLAREGTVFESAWATSSWTAPATGSLLTGRYPDAHGVTRGFFAQAAGDEPRAGEDFVELTRLPADVPTLAERFARAGYRTVGLASNVNIGPELGFDRGFETFERHDGLSVGKLLARLPELDVRLGGERPLFLYLHLNDPHFPYDGRPRFYRPPTDLPDDETAAEALRRRALYASEIGLVDDALRTALLDLGLCAETLVAFTADHGEEFQDHGGWYHLFTLYAELTRIPFFLRGPALGIESARVVAPVSAVDLAPTLARLADLPPLEERDGTSLAPLLGAPWRDEPLPELERRPVFAHRLDAASGRELFSVVLGPWKYIEGPAGGELYHLERDPLEQQDQAALEPARAAELAGILDTFRSSRVPRAAERARVDLDESLYQRLETLGYVK